MAYASKFSSSIPFQGQPILSVFLDLEGRLLYFIAYQLLLKVSVQAEAIRKMSPGRSLYARPARGESASGPKRVMLYCSFGDRQ